MKLLVLLMISFAVSCSRETPQGFSSRYMADDAALRQRCADLNLTCAVRWNREDNDWVASARTKTPSPLNDDYWYAHESTREKAIGRLCVLLNGPPTIPADPPTEIIWEAK